MAELKKVIRGQTVTEQLDVINDNIENINTELEILTNNEAGYITENEIPVTSVNGKLGDVSLKAKDVGAFPNSSIIKELDLNNLKETGVYIGTYANNPYYLIVIKYNDTNIYQELIGLNFKEYRRFTNNWSEWVRDYSVENPVTASDITGINIVDTDKELNLALLEENTFVKANIKYNPSTNSLYVGNEKYATESFVEKAINMIKSVIVTELPETAVENTIYFVPNTESEEGNSFDEFIYVNGAWERVGGTSIDLTPFLTIENAEKTYAKISSLDDKVSKTITINGKTLYNNITLTAKDVGALPSDTKIVGDVVYRHTNTDITNKLDAGEFIENDVVLAIDEGDYKKGHFYKYSSGALTDITDIITDYVDLDSDQTIKGIKNFTGVLRTNGVAVANVDELEAVENKIPTIDTTLSTTSTNPVENKAITSELNKKALQSDLEELSGVVDLKANTSYVNEELETKVKQYNNTTGNPTIYGRDQTNKEYQYSLIGDRPTAWSILQRNDKGQIVVGEPTADNHGATKKYVDDVGNTKIDKYVSPDGNNYVYGSLWNGEQNNFKINRETAEGYTLVQRSDEGVIVTGEPTATNHATTKNYVDNATKDKATIDFVNSSISTNTATFKGTYSTLAELQAVTADANDYGFVISTDSLGNRVFKRYKYSDGSWVFEYDLNNSSFTAEQWSAINSGITSTLKGKITTNESNISNLQNNKEDKSNLKALAYKDSLSKSDVGLGDVDNTSDASKPVSNATQTALNNKVDKTTTINGKALSTNITLNANDIGALPNTTNVLTWGNNTAQKSNDGFISLSLRNENNSVTGQVDFQVEEGTGTIIGATDLNSNGKSSILIQNIDLETFNGSAYMYDSQGNIIHMSPTTGEVFEVIQLPSGKSGTLALTEDFPDTSSFITKDVSNLTNYKNNTQLTSLLNAKQDSITSSNKLSKDLVSGLGTASSANTGTSSGNVPVLGSNGKLPSSVIPASAITDTFVAGSQSAMLALSSAEVGDVCVRTDLNKSFILKATPYSTLSNWQELLTPTDAVKSVNGQTGTVNLTASDVGALPSTTTIPTVNNGTLTVQKNGTSVGTFTANQSSNSTINITVPTGAAADKGVVTSIDTSANLPTSNAVKTFVEGKGYVTSSGSVANATKLNNQDASYYLNYNNFTNRPTIPTVNNGTLTIQQNGTTKGTFTANQSGNTTINLSIPNFVTLTQAEYDALATKDANTYYFIKE